MKAMILAAGRGERLKPLTDRTPKPMVPVGGRPLLAHQLGWLARAGIRHVVINLHHLGQQIVDAFGDGSEHGVRITYSLEPELLETGGGIVKALPLLGREPFLLMNGDIFTDFPLSALPPRLPADAKAHLVVVPRPPFRDRGDFDLEPLRRSGTTTRGSGLQTAKKNSPHPHITRITTRGTTHVYAGIALLDPAALAGRNAEPFSLRDVYFELMEASALTAQVWQGYWTDIGTPAQLEAVNQDFPGER